MRCASHTERFPPVMFRSKHFWEFQFLRAMKWSDSGYAEGLPEMKLLAGARFLQKPFRFSALLESLCQLQIHK